MENSEFKPLSQTGDQKAREPLAPVQPNKDETLVKKASSSMFASDRATIGNYIISDVLMPTIKQTLYDILTGSLSMAFWGNSRAGRRTTFNGDKVSYDKMFGRSQPSSKPSDRYGDKISDDILRFKERRDAQDVLDRLGDIMAQYRSVQVNDLYEILGRTAPYTARNWGWYNLMGSKVRFDTYIGWWVLELPPVEPLRR